VQVGTAQVDRWKTMSEKYAIVIRDSREFDAPWRVRGIQWTIVDDSGRIVAIARNEDDAKDKLRELEVRYECGVQSSQDRT
jgi:hypothetical protein